MLISICWMIPLLLLSMPLTKVFGSFGLACGTRDCVIIQDDAGKKFLNTLTLFGFLLPVFTLIIANIAIYAKVKVRIEKSRCHFMINSNNISDISLYPMKCRFSKLQSIGKAAVMSREDSGSGDTMKRGFSHQTNRAREERESRITKMMLIVFTCFLVCYLPPFIYLMVRSF